MAWWDDESVSTDNIDDPYYVFAGPGAMPDPYDVALDGLDEPEAVVA